MRLKIRAFISDAQTKLEEMRRQLPTLHMLTEQERRHFEGNMAQIEAMIAHFTAQEAQDA